MAKKKDKRASRADTVRSAVDQAFQATAQATADAGQVTRGRAAEIADELVGNITRLRDVLEDARPASAEDIKALRSEIAALGGRVRALETARAAAAIQGDGAPAKPAARPATARRGSPKPTGDTPSATASASRTAAAKRTRAAAAAAKPAAAEPKAASKPRKVASPAGAKAKPTAAGGRAAATGPMAPKAGGPSGAKSRG